MSGTSHLTVLALAGAAPCAAQSLSIVAMEGDAVPGVGTITRIDAVAVADDGMTLIEADTDHPDTTRDSVLLRNGALFLREGQGLTTPAGAEIDSFDGLSQVPGRPTLMNLFLSGTTGSSDDSGLYLDGDLVLQESAISGAAGFAPGTRYLGFFDAEYSTDSRFLAVASVDDPTIASPVDRALVVLEVDPNGQLTNEVVVVKEGDLLPGQTEAVADIETDAEESAINRHGSVLYGADLTGPFATDRVLYLDQTLLLQEGTPSPIPGRDWGSLLSVEVDLNDAGHWIAKTNLDASDTTTDDVLVRNGEIFQRAGDTLADIAPFTLTGFGGSVGVWISSTGDVIWFGQWNDPDTSRNEGIFYNDRLILQEGVTQVGGMTIIDLSDITEQVVASPDGRIVLVEGEVDGGGTDLDVVVRIDFEIGTRFCPNLPNSTGSPGVMGLIGSPVVADDDLTLRCGNLPNNAFGFFITSLTPGPVAGPPTTVGDLCVTGAIGRYVGPGQVRNSMTSGEFRLAVDLTLHPQPTGLVAVMPGESWYFQAWHRDVIGGSATSVFSEGIGLTFL